MHQLDWPRWRSGPLLLLAIVVALGQVSDARGDTPLTLTVVNGEERYTLSLREIESLGLHEVTMRHPEGPQGTFAGVWLDTLLKSQGLDEARRVRFTAEDGYTTFLSPGQRRDKTYLLVTRLDGEPLKPEDLGPLMLIVPEDAEAALDGTVSITRWIWGIGEIQVK